MDFEMYVRFRKGERNEVISIWENYTSKVVNLVLLKKKKTLSTSVPSLYWVLEMIACLGTLLHFVAEVFSHILKWWICCEEISTLKEFLWQKSLFLGDIEGDWFLFSKYRTSSRNNWKSITLVHTHLPLHHGLPIWHSYRCLSVFDT